MTNRFRFHSTHGTKDKANGMSKYLWKQGARTKVVGKRGNWSVFVNWRKGYSK